MMMLSCRKTVGRWAQGIDSASPWERLSVYTHLAFCWVCRRYVSQLKTLGRAVRALKEQSIDLNRLAELERRLLQKFTRPN